MNDDLEYNFEKARERINKCLPVSGGGAGAERAYAVAYQRLVQAGRKPQIKKKYRA